MCAVNEKKQVQLCVAKLIGLRFLYLAIVSSLFFLSVGLFLVGSYLLLSFSAFVNIFATRDNCKSVLSFGKCLLFLFIIFFTLILVVLRVILMLFFNGLLGFLRAHRSCFRPFEIFL